MLSSGWDCMMSDVDVLWFESPWPWLGGVGVTVFPEAARMAHADVLISTDIVEVEAYSVHAQWLQNREYNTGIVFFRATNASIALVRLWRQRVQIEGAIKGLYINDQAVFNRMTHGSHGPLLDYPPGTPPPDLDPESVVGVYVVSSPIMAPEGVTVSLGVLPFTRFCSGHVFFINRLPQRFGHRAAAVHATYQYADEKVYSYGKRHRLRQAQGWHIDPPDYFEAGSFLVIAGDSLLADANYTQAQLAVWRGKEHRGTDRRSDNGIALHFRMERVQRRRLRDAFALAIALNRTLVLPEMTCFCDRYWWLVHACRMPGAESMPLPIACPLDHLHDIGRFYDQQLQFREAGFLSNPRVPAALAASRARLVVGRGAPPRAPGYDDGQPASAELLVEDGLTLEGAAAAVGAHPAGAARVLEVALRDLGAFCGFADPARGSAVDARLRAAFSLEFNVCGEEDNVLPLVNWDPVAMPLNCTRGYLGLYPDSIAATAEALPACAAAAAAAAAGADGRAPRR